MSNVCSMLLRLPPLSKTGVHHESIVQNFVHLVSVVLRYDVVMLCVTVNVFCTYSCTSVFGF